MKWIPVSKRLPKLDVDVLLLDRWVSTYGKDKKEYTDYRIGHMKSYTTRKSSAGVVHDIEWGGSEFAFNITHWMPLPKPPTP